MQIVYFLIVGLIQFGIALFGLVKLRKKINSYAILVIIVVFGLAYDNFAVAIGGLLPEGELLKIINLPRFWIHALTTPTMMIAAFGALRLTGSKFAASKTWHAFICLLTTALIALGSYIDIFNLTLVPETENGLIRYVNAFDLFKGPPIAPVGTILVVLILSIVLWKNARFPWLFIGAVMEFIAAAATGLLLVQNIGEIAFAAGLVAAQIFAAQNTRRV
jgi:hypothetical protein